MKQWFTFFTTSIVVLFTFSIVFFQSCKKKDIKYNDTTTVQPCKDVVCFNGGNCFNGLCQCPDGFEDAHCSTKWSAKFIGSYDVLDDCNTNSNLYTVFIGDVSGDATQLRLNNLGVLCSNAIINATITPEKTSFVIPMQNTCANYYVSGQGNYFEGSINISLSYRDTLAHTTTLCSMYLTKK
ncbi:MAG: hypothetical protein R2831_09900 [Chitinophagaceae bacterium]